MKETILVLVSAHFVADFLFQPDWLHRCKKQLWGLSLHALIIAAVAYLFLQQWSVWQVPALAFVSHALVDFIKQRCVDTWRSFCIDRLAHILFSIAIVLLCLGGNWLTEFSGAGLRLMLLFAGFSVSVHAAGFLVGKVAAKLQKENHLEDKLTGLKDGGRLIGQLERCLIFLFILMGQPGGIGFLVAAKSILRFSEAKESQKLAEYVLIGTLLSFGLAIASASLALALIKSIQP